MRLWTEKREVIFCSVRCLRNGFNPPEILPPCMIASRGRIRVFSLTTSLGCIDEVGGNIASPVLERLNDPALLMYERFSSRLVAVRCPLADLGARTGC